MEDWVKQGLKVINNYRGGMEDWEAVQGHDLS